MRILYLQQAERFGGAERQALVAMRLLPEYGVEVLPVVGPGKPLCSALDEARTRYVYCPELPDGFEGPASYRARVARTAGYVRSYFQLRDRVAALAKEFDADLIYASRPFGWVVGGGAARRAGLPVVWRTGSRTTTLHQRFWLKIGAWRFRPTALVGNCQAVIDSLAPLMSCPTFVARNGVDLAVFDPRRVRPWFRSLPGIGNSPVIGVVARPAPEKGFDSLVAAMSMLVERVPSVKLLIAGDYPWRAQYEEALARTSKGATHFVGHTDDIASFYASCDVVCLASRERSVEGSSNAVLEAMAMKRAVVATRVGGIPEAVTHGIHGYLVPPDDPYSLSHYLTSLLLSPLLRQRMGNAGRAMIECSYSDRESVRRLAEVLGHISGKRTVMAEAAE